MSGSRFTAVVSGSLVSLLLVGIPAASQQASPMPQVAYPVQLSGPSSVRNLPPPAHVPTSPRQIPVYRPPFSPHTGNVADPVLQTSTPTFSAATALGQWEGIDRKSVV